MATSVISGMARSLLMAVINDGVVNTDFDFLEPLFAFILGPEFICDEATQYNA